MFHNRQTHCSPWFHPLSTHNFCFVMKYHYSGIFLSIYQKNRMPLVKIQVCLDKNQHRSSCCLLKMAFVYTGIRNNLSFTLREAGTIIENGHEEYHEYVNETTTIPKCRKSTTHHIFVSFRIF